MQNLINFMKRRYIWIGVAVLIVVIIGWRIQSSKNKAAFVAVHTVQEEDIKQSVLATGTVTSQSNLNLSFKNGGVLKKLNVSVGDKVRTGQVLAMLDQKDVSAAINQASASLLAAKANYNKVLNGASGAEVTVSQAAVSAAQVALDNAKNSYNSVVAQQKVVVSNAQSAMFNSGLAGTAGINNTGTAIFTVSGTYSSTEIVQYKVTFSSTGNGAYYNAVGGTDSSSGFLNRGVPAPLGTRGLYFTLSASGILSPSDYWTIDVPNTQSSTYLTAQNAYQAALQNQSQAVTSASGAIDSAQAALDQAKAQLALKQSSARPEDLQAAQAQIETANAQLQSAQNQYSNNVITSPIDGIVTAVDLKLGENIIPQKSAVVVLDQTSLHVETNISESSISQVQQGQSVDMTMDAFGPDKHFSGAILSIDPASTVVSGIINYRVISSIPNDNTIKPGMTVNLTILIAEKDHAIAVPNRLIKTVDGKKFVSVLSGNTASDVEITTGLTGDTMTEVLSGLQTGAILAGPADKGTAS
ncbi:MAG: hypothetical protein JWO40_86 [Candidatus Doudnabacteria bacterium]|nr:hypothetical protein [Candidatus Doudnabacteria bacterium]